MIVTPSVDQILEGVITVVEDEIIPALSNPKSISTAHMIQSLLQGVRQMLPELDQQLVEEHNDMIRTVRDTAAAVGAAVGAAADRIRARAATLGELEELPAPMDREAARAAYDELSRALEASFRDLDELQRAGVDSAVAARQVVRAHLAPRYLRDTALIKVGEGFVGRS